MKKRIVTIALVIALLATCFAGTYAYLTDSYAIANTFTVGNVYIELTETGAVNGKNAYHLIPNNSYTKDPTITLKAGSENAWIAAKITFSNKDAYALLSGGVLNTDAVILEWDENVLYVYVKASQVAEEKIELFKALTIPETWDNADMDKLKGMKIDVAAYAVQANGFNDCKSAMATAFAGAFPANP